MQASVAREMKLLARADIPTRWGDFEILSFGEDDTELSPHLAILSLADTHRSDVLVRIHSECMTGDLFGSARCDCGDQFDKSLREIKLHGGAMIYLRQEGRGIGLTKKLRAYQLQDKGLNTIEANIELGHRPDERSYHLAVEILELLKITSIRLLTNNPDKIRAIEASDIELIERVPLVIPPTSQSSSYLDTKRDEMGHLLGG